MKMNPIILIVILCALAFTVSKLRQKFSRSGNIDLDDQEVPTSVEEKKKKIKKSDWGTRWDWIKKHWNGELLPALVGLILIHIAIWTLWPTFWLDSWKKIGFWVFQAVCLAGFLMLPKGKQPAKHKIGWLLVGLSILLILDVLNWLPISEAAYLRNKTDNGKTLQSFLSPSRVQTQTWSEKPVLFRPNDPPGKDVEAVRTFFKKKLTPEEAEEMVIICKNESSGCNQFGADGKVTRHRNEEGALDDIGAMQINLGWWYEEVAEETKRGSDEITSFDLDTLDGNLMAALHLRQKYGLDPWKTSKRDIYHAQVISAPPEPDKWVKIPSPGYLGITPYGPVEIRTDDGRVFQYHVGDQLKLGFSKSLEFHSLNGEVVKVHISKL
jgi:hypothetical protein